VDLNGDGVIDTEAGDSLGEDLNGVAGIQDGVVVVEAYGVIHIFSGVTSIFADLDNGDPEDDVLTVDPALNIPVIVRAGGGKDEIQTGLGPTRSPATPTRTRSPPAAATTRWPPAAATTPSSATPGPTSCTATTATTSSTASTTTARTWATPAT
jgi:hypothetical protein